MVFFLFVYYITIGSRNVKNVNEDTLVLQCYVVVKINRPNAFFSCNAMLVTVWLDLNIFSSYLFVWSIQSGGSILLLKYIWYFIAQPNVSITSGNVTDSPSTEHFSQVNACSIKSDWVTLYKTHKGTVNQTMLDKKMLLWHIALKPDGLSHVTPTKHYCTRRSVSKMNSNCNNLNW